MKIFLLLVAVIVILITIFFVIHRPLAAASKVLLLVSQEFPQIPFKPLHRITSKPSMEKVQFGKQKIVGDLFVPHNTNKKPAIIIAMGVKTSDKDRPILLSFCETLARLGYVVLWPRRVDLEKDVIRFEEPQTFIDGFSYLEERSDVGKNKISFIGFSVGSSLTLVAAEDKKINNKIRSVVFFGGYYNILDYLSALSTKTLILDKKTIKWEAAESAIDQAQEILEKEGLALDLFNNKSPLDPDLTYRLLRFSPDQNIDSLKAKIFILHEKSDTFVPYTESIKLKQALEALPAGRKVSYVHRQANLFEHVQPKKEISYETVREYLGLFGFLYKVFSFL